MAFNRGMRSYTKLLITSEASLFKSANSEPKSVRKSASWHWKAGSRAFHSTGMKRMGGHGHDEPYYMHAKHMYNLDRMKNQKLTMRLGVFTAFSIGVGVPIYAVVFQQKKTASA